MNNAFNSAPAIMNDGRNFAKWTPTPIQSEQIRKDSGAKTTNWEYRRYMMEQADFIIRENQRNAFMETGGIQWVDGNTNAYSPPALGQTPYLYRNVEDNRPVYELNSDLKNLYLADVQLQSRMVTPVFTQAQLLQQHYARAN